jgi:hypothetical protein
MSVVSNSPPARDQRADFEVVEFNRSSRGIALVLGFGVLLLPPVLLVSSLVPFGVPVVYCVGAGVLVGAVLAVSAVRSARTLSWMEVGPRGLAYVAGDKRAEFVWTEVVRVGPTWGPGLAGVGTTTALVIEPVRRPESGTARQSRRRGSLTYSFAMRGYPVTYLGMNAEKWSDVGVAVQRHAPEKWSTATIAG